MIKVPQMIGLLIALPIMLSAHTIPDAQIAQSVRDYFSRFRTGPELISVELVNHHQTGRTLKLRIIANRNTSGKDLAFAFAAAAAVANQAVKPLELFWVEMDINFKGSETTLALAPVNCTVDALIFGNCETEQWWKDCLQFP
jgi:hypothetical protein